MLLLPLAAVAVLGVGLLRDPSSITIEVKRGRAAAVSLEVEPGATVAEVVAEAGLEPRDGRLLSITTGKVLDPRRRPATYRLDGRPASATTRVTRGARSVTVVDGTDATEPTRSVEEEIPVPPAPDTLRLVEERGVPGLVRKVVGEVSGEEVSSTTVVEMRPPAATTRKVVALTFDDGPTNAWTPYVLEILRSRGVKATFCMVGTSVLNATDMARRVVDEGHQVCNHSQGHDLGMADADQARLDAQIKGGRQTMLDAGLPAPEFYRPPGGITTDAIVATARSQGERILMWKVDTKDWQERSSVESIMANLRSQVAPGAIILLHDAGGKGRNTTLAALPMMIDELRAQGYEFTFPVIDAA